MSLHQQRQTTVAAEDSDRAQALSAPAQALSAPAQALGERTQLVLDAVIAISRDGPRVVWMDSPTHEAIWVRDIRKRVAEQLAASPPAVTDKGTIWSRLRRALEVLFDRDIVGWDGEVCWLTERGRRELRR